MLFANDYAHTPDVFMSISIVNTLILLRKFTSIKFKP